MFGRCAGFALLGWACAEPLKISCAAAMLVATVPKRRRRWRLISSDILMVAIGESPSCHGWLWSAPEQMPARQMRAGRIRELSGSHQFGPDVDVAACCGRNLGANPVSLKPRP